ARDEDPDCFGKCARGVSAELGPNPSAGIVSAAARIEEAKALARHCGDIGLQRCRQPRAPGKERRGAVRRARNTRSGDGLVFHAERKRRSGSRRLFFLDCANGSATNQPRHGHRVVDDVELEIGQGEVVGLLGPNGAGKTTTFYILVGLARPDSGRVLLNGDEITDLPMYLRARSGISYLPQEPSVFRQLTSEENLLAVLETLPLTPEQQRDRLEELLVQMGLETVRTSKAYTLSGGERRRLEIARSLTLQPSFILLDEPFSGIDPLTVKDLQEIIRELATSGIGVLITD